MTALLETHPAANLFPLLEGQEFEALVGDIRQHGLREPIVIDRHDRVLDGRNRYRACSTLGIEPSIRRFDGDDAEALAYVVSLNLRRRHLSESQRAMVAARIANLGRGANQHDEGTSIDVASNLLNVGRASVDRARAVQRDGIPELVEAVERGAVAVSKAAEIAKEPAESQRAWAHSMAVMSSSASDEWYTPPKIFEMAVEMMGAIDVDPSWHPESPIRASVTYTQEQDGLAHQWHGRAWLNPPYGRAIGTWIDRLVAEYNAGRVTEALALIPARVDTEWFRALDPFPRCYVYGRLVFGNSTNPTPFPCCLPYLGPNVARFAEVFGRIGGIWVRIEDATNA